MGSKIMITLKEFKAAINAVDSKYDELPVLQYNEEDEGCEVTGMFKIETKKNKSYCKGDHPLEDCNENQKAFVIHSENMWMDGKDLKDYLFVSDFIRKITAQNDLERAERARKNKKLATKK